MKKKVCGLIVLLVMASSSSGMAEMKKGALSVTPSIGGYLFENKENLKNPLIYSLRFGSNITPNWGFEGSFYYGDSENEALSGKTDADLFGYGVEALYHFMPEGKLVPFLAAGVGGTTIHRTGIGSDARAMVDYGAGLKYFVTEDIALRADVRHVIPLNHSNDNLLYTLGVNFFFGGEKKAPPVMAAAKAAEPAPAPRAVIEAPKDSDGDGVVDSRDLCPGTPSGVQVDSNGCPLDSDRDGVYDYLDKCPGTPAGVKVDQNGCPPPPPQVQKAAPPAASPVEKAIVEKGRVKLNVEFDTNKAIVKPNYNSDINQLAIVMKKYTDLKITIEGHTDNVGGAKYNETLSRRRADAVKKILVDKHGIEASRLTAKGYGLTKPVATNDTKEGRQKNRRVEAAAEYTITKK